VIAATLLIRSLFELTRADPGFHTQHVLAIKMSPDSSFCREPAACVSFYDRILTEGRGVQGIVDAALTNSVPLDGSAPSLAVDVEDHPKTADFPAPMFWAGAITPGYLQLMGIPLLDGRWFTPADAGGSEPVLLISASTARRFWPGQNAIGKHVKWVSEQRWRRVVGIVADVRQFDLTDRAPAGITGAMYLPYSQSIDGDGRIPHVMTLLVKSGSSDPGIADSLHNFATAVNPNIPVSKVFRLDTSVTDSVSSFRSTAWLFLVFAAVALILATIGVYGLVSYSVTQRSYEMGLRMAVGASAGSILRMVLLGSVRVSLLGVSAGLVIAFAAIRVLTSVVAEVTYTDLPVFAFVTAFLLAVTIIASLVPAVRASRIDPVRILRAE